MVTGPDQRGPARRHPCGRLADQGRHATRSPADCWVLVTKHHLTAMDLEDVRGEIETNRRDMHWSGSLSGAEAITLTS